MKKTKIIIPAMGMLLLGTAASVTGTVAWFSMNQTVSVNGMQVTTKVSNNLLISATNVEANYTAGPLAQTRTGILEPVSTVDGVSFWYHSVTSGVNGDGSATAAFTQYTEAAMNESWTAPLAVCAGAGKVDQYDAGFNTAYGNTVANDSTNVLFGYIDYTFYLKATSTADNQIVSLTKCNLTKNSPAEALASTDRAWRVAVFSQKVDEAASPSSVGTKISLLAPTSAVNFDGKAANGASTTAAVTYGTAATLDNDLDAGVTQRYKVVIRMYLEGNDNTCNNTTYAPLSDIPYNLDLQFTLGETTGVTVIGSVAA